MGNRRRRLFVRKEACRHLFMFFFGFVFQCVGVSLAVPSLFQEMGHWHAKYNPSWYYFFFATLAVLCMSPCLYLQKLKRL